LKPKQRKALDELGEAITKFLHEVVPGTENFKLVFIEEDPKFRAMMEIYGLMMPPPLPKGMLSISSIC
jgi:hypothetical protein